MITDRSQYEWVTIPQGIAINGGVMPLRSAADDLRGEDVCFLAEARKQRQMTVFDGTFFDHTATIYDNPATPFPMSRQIAAAQMADAIPSFGHQCVKARMAGIVHGASGFDLVPSSDLRLSGSAGDYFAAGGRLRADHVSDAFEDLKQLTAMSLPIPSTSGCAASLAETAGNWQGQLTAKAGNVVFWDSLNWSGVPGYADSYWEGISILSSDEVICTGSNLARFFDAWELWISFAMTADYKNGTAEISLRGEQGMAKLRAGTGLSSGITLHREDLRGAFADIVQSYGGQLLHYPSMASTDKCTWSMTFTPILFTEFGDHTKWW